MIVLDTSVLVDSLTRERPLASHLRAAIVDRHRLRVPALVLYEWFRGPRLPEELAAQEHLFPAAQAIGFGAAEARVAADLYRQVSRPRGREIDLAIAACALVREATLWTRNEPDFDDIPGLELFQIG